MDWIEKVKSMEWLIVEKGSAIVTAMGKKQTMTTQRTKSDKLLWKQYFNFLITELVITIRAFKWQGHGIWAVCMTYSTYVFL